MRHFLIFLTIVLVSGCGDRWGTAAVYHSRNKNPIPVIMPTNAPYIGQQFLPRPPDKEYSAHQGVDFWSSRGWPILAAAPGTVTRKFFDPAYGRRLSIHHGTDQNGEHVVTHYFHLSKFNVEIGDTVERGQRIGDMGVSGFLAGFVHVHFEVQFGETPRKIKPRDPHLFWADGVGRVTCFDPNASYPTDRFVTTVPLACR